MLKVKDLVKQPLGKAGQESRRRGPGVSKGLVPRSSVLLARPTQDLLAPFEPVRTLSVS